MADNSPNCVTPTKDSKRRLEFSPLCSRSLSEDNILIPMAKRPNKMSFIEMLDSVSDDTNESPEALKARRIMQKKKSHLARSMLELKCRRVLPTLMRRKKILNAEQRLKMAERNEGKELDIITQLGAVHILRNHCF